MARRIFGGNVEQLTVGLQVVLTAVTPATTTAAVLKVAPGGNVAWYDAPGGNVVTDFLLPSGSGSLMDLATYTVAATSITATGTGHLPWFAGKDGLDALWTPMDPANWATGWLRLPPNDAASTATLDEAAVRTVLDDAVDVDPDSQLTKVTVGTGTGKTITLGTSADVPSLGGDNDWLGVQDYSQATGEIHAPGAIDASSLGSMDAIMDSWAATRGIPRAERYTAGTTPPFKARTIWLGETAATPSSKLIMHQASSVDGRTFQFLPEEDMVGGAEFVLAVWGGDNTKTAGSPVAKASSIVGRSLAWAPLTGWNQAAAANVTGIVTPNGITSFIFFLGTGTPDSSGNITIDFGVGNTVLACNVIMIAMSAVNPTPTRVAYNAVSTALTAPFVTFGTSAVTTNPELLFLGRQSSTATVNTDPGTPFGIAPDLNVNNPTINTRASSRSSQTTSTWATSGNAQYCAGAIEFAAAA